MDRSLRVQVKKGQAEIVLPDYLSLDLSRNYLAKNTI
jgi:hypothetical protein